jgi:hypothetical protein
MDGRKERLPYVDNDLLDDTIYNCTQFNKLRTGIY